MGGHCSDGRHYRDYYLLSCGLRCGTSASATQPQGGSSCILHTSIIVSPDLEDRTQLTLDSIVILIGLNVQSVHRQVESNDSGVSLTDATVYRQTQILFAIVTAALPALNRSLRLFHGSLGNSWLKTTYSLSQTISKSNGRTASNADRKRSSIVLKALEPSVSRSAAKSSEEHGQTADEDSICLRPDPVGYRFTASSYPTGADAESSKSQESTGSKSRIIRMERHWHVRHEDVQ